MRRSAIFLSLLLGACAGGHAARPPSLAIPQGEWLGPLSPGAVDQQWWKRLNDSQLDALVYAALVHNLDIAEAQARLKEARANRDVSAARTSPQLQATGSATQQQQSANGAVPIGKIPGVEREFALFDAGFDASWEIDFWGRNRSSVAASSARERQAEARLDDVRLQVVAEVVRSYADLLSAKQRVALLREEAELRNQITKLTERRFTAGESSRQEAETAHQRESLAKAAVFEAEATATAASYRLALLTGKPPEAANTAHTSQGELPPPPALVAGDVRSELLRRRPDVRTAEADLAAATADVGIARADLYPRITLVGSLGQQSRSTDGLLDSASTRYAIGPSLSWPIFDFGRIRAQIRAAGARADAAGARYERAVLSALADSETAANAYGAALAARDDRIEALQRSETNERLAALRFKRGEDDRIQMLEASSARITAKQQALSARTQALSAYVALCKALGAVPASTANSATLK